MTKLSRLNLVSSTAVLTSILALSTASISPALANDRDVIREGSCSGATDWKLKGSPENGRIEVEGEVDSNRNGQRWNWRIVHNGNVAARGTSTTHAPSGSFEARRVVSNAAGKDGLAFRARNAASGEVCRGFLRF